MPKKYTYQLFIFKQETRKFSQDTLLCFIFKSLKIGVVLIYPILLYFQYYTILYYIILYYNIIFL